VPLSLDGVPRMCACNASYQESGHKCQVFGCLRWATSSFCSDLEVVLAFLFSGVFEVEWDAWYEDSDGSVVTYTLCDEDGKGLKKRLPVEFGTRIRAIKHPNHVPTLSILCEDEIERTQGRDAAKAAIKELGM
jgi:hypothetical protein